MEQICCLYAMQVCRNLRFVDAMRPRSLDLTLSVDDVLYVQDIFLTSGLHHIMLPDVAAGRILMSRVLESMHYYHEIACLTNTCNPPLQQNIKNIYNCLIRCYGHNASYDEVEEFFLEQYFADFMWVESSQDLMSLPLVMHAVQAMHELEIAHQIPTIVLSYGHQ